jgi:integrase
MKGQYGAKRFSLYETRHTTAVAMLKSGVEDTVVANVLGHGDASMIRRVYGRYTTKQIPNVRTKKPLD